MIMTKIRLIFKFSSFVLIFTLLACRKLDYAECTKPHQPELIIRWGDSFSKENRKIGFELNSKAELFQIEIINNNSKISKLGNANQKTYCNILSMIKNTIIKTQIVNEIGDTLRFFEYVDPRKQTNIFVKWHPRFNTKNSRGFQEIYDSLNTLKMSLK